MKWKLDMSGIDTAISGDRKVITKDAEKILKYTNVTKEIQKIDTRENRGNWSHLKIVRKIPERHTWKARRHQGNTENSHTMHCTHILESTNRISWTVTLHAAHAVTTEQLEHYRVCFTYIVTNTYIKIHKNNNNNNIMASSFVDRSVSEERAVTIFRVENKQCEQNKLGAVIGSRIDPMAAATINTVLSP